MSGPVLVALALAAAAWAVAEGRRARPDRTAPMLAAFAGGALALRGLLQLAPAVPLVLPLAGLAALVTWTALAWLAARAPRRRDLFVRMPFAVVAVLMALGGAPVGATATFACLATLAYRWRDGLPTLRLFRFALGAIGLAVALGWALPGADPARAATGALGALGTFARGVRALALAHVLIAIPVLFGAFLRDPTLGIRTVGRRLALSHVLVVAVPLVLLGALWAFTTVLGVNNERARVGVRALDHEGRQLAGTLHAALARPGDADGALRALPLATAGHLPALRVWRVRAGAVERLAGDSLAGEARLGAWTARLDSLPASGVVRIGRDGFLGAAARGPAGSGLAAVALAPIDSVLARAPGEVAAAPLRMIVGSVSTSGNGVRIGDDVFGTDSTGDAMLVPVEPREARERRAGIADSGLRVRFGPGNTSPALLAVGGDTLRSDEVDRDSSGVPFLLQGHALADGLTLGRNGFQPSRSLLAAAARPADVLAGLARNTRDDPISYLPLVLVVALALSALLVMAFDIGMVAGMGRSITAALQALKVGARKLEGGDLAHRIAVAGDDDLWDVADTFNQASAGLERARSLEQEAERLELELALARRIQARLLPAAPPSIAGLEIAGLSEPAREVGGDYFDHILLGDGRVMLVIADVSGKGVGAALLMSAFRASLMSQDSGHTAPDVLAGRLNEFLHRSVDPGKFVTAFVAFLDGRDGRMVYANAGHNPPVLLRRDGTHEMLSTGGLILGILPGSAFECGDARLEPGDLVALYTDGVTEGADASGEQWGEERLLGALRARASEPCAGLVRAIVDEVRTFEGESGPADDITLMVARRA